MLKNSILCCSIDSKFGGRKIEHRWQKSVLELISHIGKAIFMGDNRLLLPQVFDYERASDLFMFSEFNIFYLMEWGVFFSIVPGWQITKYDCISILFFFHFHVKFTRGEYEIVLIKWHWASLIFFFRLSALHCLTNVIVNRPLMCSFIMPLKCKHLRW
jgi:hypothetical protein